MYIEDKSEGVVGPARIGRVTYSKTGKSLTYHGREFAPLFGPVLSEDGHPHVIL